jgi:YD repeat-containing protein
MRRILAIVLLGAFLAQTSGSASAASSMNAGVPPLRAELGSVLLSLQTSLLDTPIIAQLTGNGDRFAAMHAAAPNFAAIPRATVVTLQQTRVDHAVPGIPAINGTVVHPAGMLDHPASAAALSAATAALTFGVSSQARSLSATPRAPSGGSVMHPLNVNSSVPSTTGINHYWSYEEGATPASGKWMLNIANGNLLAQSDDVDIPERGIDLAFRRTYNSQSGHTYANTDGSTLSNYGDRWTNTFDAHLGYDPTHNVISFYDIDGARYDYTWSGSAWTPPAGQYGTLQYDGNCGLYWTKKSGTMYYFYAPSMTVAPHCTLNPTTYAGYLGRLAGIYARNHNNNIVFTYSWSNGDASTDTHLAGIVATHSDGQALTLAFADSNGKRLLSSITRPDGKVTRYTYDANANPTDACDIGNGSTDGSPTATSYCGDTTHRHHRYGWNAGSQLQWADSPNFTSSWGTQGAYTAFVYDTSNRTTFVQYAGFVNFVPGDGTGQVLQSSAPSGLQTYRNENFTYGSGQTTLADTDGHAIIYTYDGSSRVTQTQNWNGTQYLLSGATWDAQNNMIASIDARGNESDVAYDTNGNAIAQALPSVSTIMGTLRPTSLYSYDANNNVLASCDAVSVGASGYNWVTRPQDDTLCSNRSVKTRYVYDMSDTVNEPYGRLTDTFTPLGYHHQILYATSAQGGDFGLPSDVIGDAMTQADGTNRAPHQTFSYDGYGNLHQYSTGVGSWTLTYDGLNRTTSTTDADTVTDRTCYFDNGQTKTTQTAAQYALDGAPCGLNSVSFNYDSDGNALNETHHLGGVAGITTKFYDGDDRLVEVSQPRDTGSFPGQYGPTHDLYPYAWMTRYLYDISQGQSLSIGAVSGVHAFGNLYKTVEYLPSNPIVTVGQTIPNPVWTDVRGSAFDALDRATASYEMAFGTTPKLTNAYDGSGYYGMLSQSQNANAAQTVPAYDNAGHTTSDAFANDGGMTPNRSYSYDPDGRAVSVSSTTFGAESSTYDADGRLVTHADPTGNGYQSPVTTTYGYYGDGMRQSVSIASSALSAANLFTYSYRNDGPIQKQTVNWPTTASYAWTYTNAGRELTQSDPFTGSLINVYDANGTQTGSRTLQARTQTYDAYGRVSSLTLPEGYLYGNITYDAEDEMLSYARSGGVPYADDGTMMNTYNTRGELIGEANTGVNSPFGRKGSNTSQSPSADGFLCTSNSAGPEFICGDTFDARTDMSLSNRTVMSTYDASGRNTTQTALQTSVMTRGYDAENHVVSQRYNGPNGGYNCSPDLCPPDTLNNLLINGSGPTYAWGPTGHVLETAQASASDTVSAMLHWDGDAVLLEQQEPLGANYYLNDVHVGTLGVNGSTGSWVYDRDLSGQIVAKHDSKMFAAWSSVPSHMLHLKNKDGPLPESSIGLTSSDGGGGYSSDTNSTATYFTPSREDGYQDNWGNVFQGVRVYDPVTAQWTAPDAYAGDVHDPMSQKPFMWNRNSPLGYEDPSGYDWGSIDASMSDAFNAWSQTTDGKKVFDDIASNHSITVNVVAVPLSQFAKDGEKGADGDVLFHTNAGDNRIGSVPGGGSTFGTEFNIRIAKGDSGRYQAITIGHEAFHVMDFSRRPNQSALWLNSGHVRGEQRENHEEERARLYENKISAELIFPLRPIAHAVP